LSDKEKKPEVKTAVSMMFTHFLVRSLNTLPAAHVMLILGVHFQIDPGQFRDILGAVFSRIDYERNLFAGVEELLSNDCIDLVSKVYEQKARGLVREVPAKCAKCLQKITEADLTFTLFACAHCFHPECLEGASECPVCLGRVQPEAFEESRPSKQGMWKNRTRILIRRLDEFALKPNFGGSEAATTALVDARAYFGETKIEPMAHKSVTAACFPTAADSFDISIE
jgi:hypothetical protein